MLFSWFISLEDKSLTVIGKPYTKFSYLTRNPFERESPLPSIVRKESIKDVIEEEDEDESVESSYLKKRIVTPNKPSIIKIKPSSVSVFKQTLYRRKLEEEEKICHDTFKAQNIRSLTLRMVDTY